MTAPRKPRRDLGILSLAALACAVCCAGPILGVLAALGGAALIGAIWMPALVLVAGLAALAHLWLRRRGKSSTCAVPGPVPLPSPTVRSAAPPA